MLTLRTRTDVRGWSGVAMDSHGYRSDLGILDQFYRNALVVHKVGGDAAEVMFEFVCPSWLGLSHSKRSL